MAETKKFLDQEGVKYLWSKVAMEDYPNNETLVAVLNAIDETKADKDAVPDAYKEYIESTHNDIQTFVNNLNTRLDNHEDIIDNSIMIDKSFGNGPDTVAEGNHTHGDLQLQMQSIEEVINAGYYDISDAADFFTDITPSHTVWKATSSSKVTNVDIIGGRYVCTTSTVDHGLKTENLTDLIEVVKGKTLVAAANLSSDNYTLYIKMNDGTAWSFGKIKSTDKIVTFDVPANLTQFKFGLEYKGDGSAPETCEVTNFAVYLVNDVAITSTANIPNRNYTIWSWNDEEIINPEAFAAFCNAYKINRVYQHISTSTVNLEQIRNFVGTMQKNRVSVNWLTGDPSWTLTDHHYHIVDQIQKVVSYNMSIQNDYEKIGTIQFDIEPYTLAEWDTDKASVIKQYQDAIALMYNECIAKQLSLNVCVASWFDGETYDNEYGQGNLFDFVSKHSSSTVIMAYNTSGYVSIAEDEIRISAANGKNVAVGLETHIVDDSVTEDITFANKPIEDLYRAFETLFLVYKMYGVYKGYEFVIHDYAYFKAYAESFNLTVESNDILGKLNTENKTDLISAINEINTKVESLKVSSSKVLWIGTSIPAGDISFGDNGTTDLGSNNYPKMVADSLGFTLYNNARGSSFVCFYPSSEDGTDAWANASDWSEYSNEVWKGYSLSASHAQVEEKFRSLNVPDWLIAAFKRYSYETLIIPYIDGTLASCDTVIIDHGYNDRKVIINEASWHPGDGETQFSAGSGRDWLLTLQDPFEKTLTTEGFFQGKWWNDESINSKKHYFSAMIFLCKKIWAVNPRIKIIIGNYFAKKSNVFGAEYGNDKLGEFVCLANSAIANWLQVKCVNVADTTGIYNRNLPAGNDYSLFCPDGVHPHSDSTGASNKRIRDVYVNELKGYI